MELRKWVQELMIYSPDAASKLEAEVAKSSAAGAWTLDIEQADSIVDVNIALKRYVHLKRVTFCTHGFSGGVYLEGGSITKGTLSMLAVPRDLFRGEGQLLFMGCETARDGTGRDFLIEAGRKFFAGTGGVVGGATVSVAGWPSGSVLPYLTPHWDSLPERGNLILFRLDAQGKVIGQSIAR